MKKFLLASAALFAVWAMYGLMALDAELRAATNNDPSVNWQHAISLGIPRTIEGHRYVFSDMEILTNIEKSPFLRNESLVLRWAAFEAWHGSVAFESKYLCSEHQCVNVTRTSN